MVIISESKKRKLLSIASVQRKSTHFRYALTYVVITFVVLLLLNIYISTTTQKVFRNSKESALLEKCQLASTEIASLDILNFYTVSQAVSDMVVLSDMHMVVTNQSGMEIYNSEKTESTGSYALFPEIAQSLQGYNVFSWNYNNGTMKSCAAVPIYSYGTLIGCAYMMEFDNEQGALIKSLQVNTLLITVILEVLVILYSVFFSATFTARLRKIMTSMRTIREGDYSQKVSLGGNDELTVLGNEFNILAERLNTSEQKRHQFVSDASHELKTPLASIKLLSDSILQNDMDLETVREFVADIGNEAERLNRMSQKLLSLTKIESQADGEYEIVHIAPTIEKVMRMLTAIAKESQITIQTNFSQDSPILIVEDDLYQIIFNLMENGIKYNTPGGKLTVDLYRIEDDAVVEFTDTGVGIPEDALTHIFERFYRVDKARSRKSGGSGLGLSIVRNLVERNRGEIHVESSVGKGTIFTLRFPVFDTEEEG